MNGPGSVSTVDHEELGGVQAVVALAVGRLLLLGVSVLMSWRSQR